MYTRGDLAKTARLAESRGAGDPTRRRCFVSYHRDDIDIVIQFIADYGHVFIPTVLGVTDDDEFVDSDDDEYIKRRIREEHLSTTTVTIVMLGKCTWSRRFVDWEIASSLRNDPANKRSGLLALTSPGETIATLPARIKDNWVEGKADESYAEFKVYPTTAQSLRSCIEAAFAARTSKADLVDNSRALRKRNAACP
jgi:hypothetical protein